MRHELANIQSKKTTATNTLAMSPTPVNITDIIGLIIKFSLVVELIVCWFAKQRVEVQISAQTP